MKNDKRSLLTQLVDLVSSLTKKEKQAFSRYANKPGLKREKGGSNYVQLFEFIGNGKSLDFEKFKQKTGLKDSEIITAGRHLRKTIFESLVFSDSNLISGLHIARKAQEKGFFKYAGSVLAKEISQAVSEENLEYLEILLQEAEMMRRFHQIVFTFSKIGSFQDFMSQYARYTEMKKVMADLQSYIRTSVQNRKAQHQRLAPVIERLNCESPFIRLQVRYLMMKTLWLRVGFRNSLALPYHFEMLDLIRQNAELFRVEEIIHEYRRAISLLIDQGDVSGAQRLLIELSSMEVPLHLEKIILEIWIINSAVIAADNGDMGIGRRALKDIEENEDLLPAKWKFLVFHAASVLHFYNEDWEQCIHWQVKLSRLSKSQKEGKKWIPALVKGICQYELGYPDKGEKHLQAVSKEDAPDYFSFVSEIVKEFYSHYSEAPNSKLFLQNAKAELTKRIDTEEFGYAVHYFDLRAWIESKLQQQPIKNLLPEKKSPSLFSLSYAS